MAKSRVAPMKTLTLPRLELQGAVLAIRLKETIVKEFNYSLNSIFFWTDSMLNLQYIKKEDKRFKTFVGNRISEIHEQSEPSQWRFVPSKLNPADLASRGAYLSDENEASMWFTGPNFLLLDESEWPATSVSPIDSNNEEIRSHHLHGNQPKNDLNGKVNKINFKTLLIDYTRFSSWRKLIRTIGWIMVFAKNCKSSSRRKEPSRQLTLKEEKIGRLKLFQLIQQEAFKEELKQLRRGSTAKNSVLQRFDPFLDDEGTLRVGGRLKHGDLPYLSKHQITLPSKHYVTELLVRYIHNYNHHVGREHLLSLIRQEYWVIGARVLVRKIVNQCILCQKLTAKPTYAKMADLPIHRITFPTPPFHHTGVDYFGPITVKILRSRIKRWGCIFTCLTTRAIHLEVAPSLEADDYINVMERFMCRRGKPNMLRSDCGSNFKGASKELKMEIERMNRLQIDETLRRKELK